VLATEFCHPRRKPASCSLGQVCPGLSFGTIVDRAGICASAGFPYIGYVLVAGDKPQ
jgi:hypothetical protein